MPGFEGGAAGFKPLAENLIARAVAQSFELEVWAVDRRSNQLEDMVGLDLAEQYADPQIALDWLFGGELSLTLHPLLAAGPNRRAVFYDTQADVPFIANWSPLVFSQDIDAVVTAARAVAKNQNVFLGGHSAGTGFTARYAATDFNLTGVGPADPGYAKLRGLVLLEGGGASVPATPPSADTLDRIEAKFDGGLFGAVRDNAARCVDGVTACTIATEAVDCVGQLPPKCTLPTSAYSVVPGLLNARILTAGEVTAIQAILDPDGTRERRRGRPGAPGNNAVADGARSGGPRLPRHDDGLRRPRQLRRRRRARGQPGVVRVHVGRRAGSDGGRDTHVAGHHRGRDARRGAAQQWSPAGGAAGERWGQEKEVTRMDRFAETFYKGGTNFTDVYYPGSGLGVTSVSGVCSGRRGRARSATWARRAAGGRRPRPTRNAPSPSASIRVRSRSAAQPA